MERSVNLTRPTILLHQQGVRMARRQPDLLWGRPRPAVRQSGRGCSIRLLPCRPDRLVVFGGVVMRFPGLFHWCVLFWDKIHLTQYFFFLIIPRAAQTKRWGKILLLLFSLDLQRVVIVTVTMICEHTTHTHISHTALMSFSLSDSVTEWLVTSDIIISSSCELLDLIAIKHFICQVSVGCQCHVSC